MGGELGSDFARRVLGGGAHGARSRAGKRGRAGGLQLHGHGYDGATEAGGAHRGGRAAHARLRHMADTVGGDQSVPATHRRHRATVQRCGTEHSGAVHLGALGFARVLRGADVSGNEADVRDQREQLRRGGGVRERQRAGASGDRGRRERGSGVEAFWGPGGAVRGGESPRRLLLSGAAHGTHRTGVPPWRRAAIALSESNQITPYSPRQRRRAGHGRGIGSRRITFSRMESAGATRPPGRMAPSWAVAT